MALRSFVCGRKSFLFIYAAGGVGMGGERFVGVADDEGISRRRRVLEHNRLESSRGFRGRGRRVGTLTSSAQIMNFSWARNWARLRIRMGVCVAYSIRCTAENSHNEGETWVVVQKRVHMETCR